MFIISKFVIALISPLGSALLGGGTTMNGLEVIPAATDHEVTALPGWRKWLPDTEALDGSSRAIKEIVGHLVGR